MTYDPWRGHPLNGETVEESRAKFVARKLRRYRLAVQAGRLEAIADALAFCAEWGARPPDWLTASRKQAAPQRKPGRPPADEADFVRWDMVQECRDRRGEIGIPLTWEETWHAVSDMLRGSPHWGTAETIRASYKRVLGRSRASPGRYYIKDL